MAAHPFPRFPKVRPPLPPEHAAFYVDYYVKNREGMTRATGTAAKLESWMHRKVARDAAERGRTRPADTLEIGAGTLNHLRFEPNHGPYDIVEPFHALFQSSPLLAETRAVYDDIGAIDPATRYDRIISIATFEHLLDLPRVVALASLHLGTGGTMRVAIPSEGSIGWRLGWTLSTGLEFRLKYGLDYGALMRHEHVNTWREVKQALAYFFADVKQSVFGFSPSLSFYHYYECQHPRREAAQTFLSEWAADAGPRA